MPTTSLTTAEAGAQITRDNYDWNASLGTGLTISWAFRTNAPAGGIDGGGSGFSEFNSAQIAATLKAIQCWSDVANITFSRVGTGTSGSGAYSDNATLLLGNYSSGAAGAAAYAYDPATKDSGVGTANDYEGDVWINNSLAYNSSNTYTSGGSSYLGLAEGGYGAQVLLHEIGHALGLEHPGAYDAQGGGTITYSGDAEYVEDTRQYSVMSYFSETNTGADFKGYYGMAPMMDDIAAIQRLYGANTTAFSGDTTWGFNSNTGRAWYSATVGSFSPQIYCVWDTGGVDTLDYSGFSDNQKIDLNSGRGHFSDVGGMVGNVSIYDGVVIENAKGGSGADQIYGNGADNHLWGADGADTLHGGDGADTLEGGAGADLMSGDAGNDLYLYDGSDTIIDSSGNDTVQVDTASFNFGSLSVSNGNFAGIENLTAIGSGDIDLTGDGNANTLIGSNGANSIAGGGGDDGLIGNGGADTLDAGSTGSDTLSGGGGDDLLVFHGGTGAAIGGSGTDTLSVDLAGQSVTASGSFISWSGGSISFSGIEVFNINAASISGFITGGDGTDFYFVTTSTQMVTVDGGDGNDVLYANFAAYGGAMRSDLESNTFRNAARSVGVSYLNIEQFVVDTGAGDDFIQTGSGTDTVRTRGGADVIDTGTGTAFVDGGGGVDKWIADLSASNLSGVLDLNASGTQAFMGGTVANIEQLQLKTGSGADSITTLIGASGQTNDYVFTGGGADTIKVGGGMDTADGSDGTDTLVVDLHWTSEAIRSDLESSTFRSASRTLGVAYYNIEKFDVATGSGADFLQTGAGADTVSAGAGDDIIDTQQGAAVVDGGAGVDKWVADLSASGQNGVLDLNLPGTQAFLGGSVTGIEQLQLLTGSGADSITTLVGAAIQTNDYVFTGLGNDTITSGGGMDTVDGSDGNDTLVLDLHWTSEAIRSDLESNTFRNATRSLGATYLNVEQFDVATGSGDDYILTGAGSDTVSAGGGDDKIDTQQGYANVNGGAGADWWLADFSTATAKIGINLAKASQVFNGGRVAGIEQVSLKTGAGADKIDTLVGATKAYADYVFTGAGNDHILVGGGNDTVDGSNGTDTLVVDYSWATDAISSQLQSQSFRNASASIGVNFSNIENFEVSTGSGDDYIQTGDGRDKVSTGAGDDVIDTGAGVAIVNGGDGFDRWIANFAAATADGDLDLNKAGRFLGGSVKGIEAVSLTLGSGDDAIVTKVGPAALYADYVYGGAGDDVITSGGGQDTVDGGDGGGDTLVVDYSWDSHAVSVSGGVIGDGAGSSVTYYNVERFDFRGGDGADTLSGGQGADTLTGGAGADQFAGGAGADRFIYERISDSTIKAPDIILDLENSDRIDLHLIDADTTTPGNQAFHIANKFTKHAGDLVLTYDAGSDRTSVSGDVNGDGKADFTILLAGDHHNFAGFVL